MKILVINTGSSSIKYKLFDVDRRREMSSGLAEKIGEKTSLLAHRVFDDDGSVRETTKKGRVVDHREGMEAIVELLVDPEVGAIGDKADITAVGHRVVHGGETFRQPVIVDDTVIAAIRENIPLAPLHNPPNLTGIEIARAIFPAAPQIAVFDTAFHQSLPMEAFLYAIPFELYEQQRVRRYGFHGTSHAYVAGQAAEQLGRPLEELNLITIHLGNGASMAAVRRGKCVDTSMGLTPLAGLVMGTRSGDVDPALPFFLADHLGMSLRQIDDLLNRESGMKGLCGSIDMREILAKRAAGDRRAKLAVEVYAYRVKKYIGAFLAVLGRLDALVFTAGVGENSPEIRELCCRGLEELGIAVDAGRNDCAGGEAVDVALPASRVRILVIPTNEELKIAQETKKIMEEHMSFDGKEFPVSADRFDAVLFDMDGVLTATAKLHAVAWKKMFDEYLKMHSGRTGEPFRPFDSGADYVHYVDGKLRSDGVQSFLRSRGIDLPWGDPADPPEGETVCALGNRKNKLVGEAIESEGVEVFPGAVALVKRLRQIHVKTAVVSASRNCQTLLQAAGIEDLFEVRVDGVVAEEMNLSGKPAPDTFLKAAELLGVPPARAVVVEDAISGVQAGRAGGFGLVIGVDHKGDPDTLIEHGADIVVTDLGELIKER